MSVVLGYDESPGAHRALETAILVATRFGLPLVLVYGAAPPGSLGEEFESHVEALEEAGRRAAAHAVARAEAAGVETEVAVVRAKPAEALAAVAEERDALMIVVGSYGESPLRGALLGSTPHRLLHIAARPVLVVPAHGEVTTAPG
jgi:nucleotide-binding universal stress UspA family protein